MTDPFGVNTAGSRANQDLRLGRQIYTIYLVARDLIEM